MATEVNSAQCVAYFHLRSRHFHRKASDDEAGFSRANLLSSMCVSKEPNVAPEEEFRLQD